MNSLSPRFPAARCDDSEVTPDAWSACEHLQLTRYRRLRFMARASSPRKRIKADRRDGGAGSCASCGRAAALALLGLIALVVAVYVDARAAAELRRAQILAQRPDDPRPRRRRHGDRLARAELWRMAELRPDPAGDARRDGLGRGSPLPHPYRRRSDRHAARAASSPSSIAAPAGASRAPRRSPSRSRARSSCRTDIDVGRKIREAILALALERKFTKDQILELYLNKVYFGGGAYGIDAAAANSSATAPTQLTLAEAAVIAGLVKAPSHYSPTADAEAAIGRAGVVLQLMAGNRRDHRRSRPRDADPQGCQAGARAQAEQRALFHRLGAAAARNADRRDQPRRSKSGRRSISTCSAPPTPRSAPMRPPGAQGALVALDRDGAVRAMVGGKDYVASIYNRATQAVRQPGSAFKLFVYLAALEAGHQARRSRSSTSRSRSTAGARATIRAAIRRPDDAAHRLRLFDQHRRGQARARRSASARSPTWRGASASPRRSTPIPRWCSAPPTCG